MKLGREGLHQQDLCRIAQPYSALSPASQHESARKLVKIKADHPQPTDHNSSMTHQILEKIEKLNQQEDEQGVHEDQHPQERVEEQEALNVTQKVRLTQRVARKPPASSNDVKMLSLKSAQPLHRKILKPRRKLATEKGSRDIRAYLMRGKVTQGGGGGLDKHRGHQGEGWGRDLVAIKGFREPQQHST